MRRLSAIVVGLVVAAAARPQPVAPPPVSPLVGVQEGALPVIISAPHGGTKEVPGVPPRTGEGFAKGPSGFFAGRDTGTEELAEAIAREVERRFGRKPNFVIARFHRKYIDANRPAEIGIENPKARPTYDAYHQTLAAYSRAVQKAHGRGLLIDVHGQGTAADTIFRGTRNGQTVKLLVERFGEKAHNGPDSFFGFLDAAGCTTHPHDGAKEQPGFTGGYIVQTYGSHTAYGIDAIQLEFGGQYRKKDAIADTAKKVGEAVARYAEKYLPVKPLAKPAGAGS
jgi:N-formylglutamate amidohydrolase